MRHLLRSIAVALAAISIYAFPAVGQEKNRNVQFGKPSKVKAFEDPKHEDFHIEREAYVLSYNSKKCIPNWVSWSLVKSDIGNVARGSFEPDPGLPKHFPHVTHGTYIAVGFDRGHMCPSKDRSDTEDHNDATFFMTNIIPQSPKNNQGAWERLESYCRELVKKGNELHIVCGPHGVGGEGKLGRMSEISKGKIHVTVPAKTWKVIMVLPKGKTTPNLRTRMIAIITPNDQTVTEEWGNYRVSVADVEKLTGYRFFPSIPADIARAIKNNVDDERIIQTPRPTSK